MANIKKFVGTSWTVIREVIVLAVMSVPILLYYSVVAVIFILSFIPVLIAGIGVHNKRRN